MEGDTLFVNGRIWGRGGARHSWMTVDPAGRISGIGSGPQPSASRRVDLGDRCVLPGLHDAHIHVYETGHLASTLNLEQAGSIEELADRLREHADGCGARLVEGTHWDQDKLGRLPHRADLDQVLPDRPAVLFRRCWHVLVCNSAALAACGISKETVEPAGGFIDRDLDGEPTGVLREAAMELLGPLTRREADGMPEHKRRVLEGLRLCLRNGCTSVQTNDGSVVGGVQDPWAVYRQLEGQLPIRVLLTLPDSDALAAGTPPGPWQPGSRLSCDRAKIFADGGLGASTAALEQPYADGPDNCGILQLSPEVLRERVRQLHAAGWRIEAHAIGDRAAREVLDALAQAGVGGEARPVLTHCQILSPALIERIGRMQVLANVQPQFTHSDSNIALKRVGPDRLRSSYAWRSLIEAGAVVCGGSDAPVEEPRPLHGLYYAITRRGLDGQVVQPEQRLSFEQALELYTVNAAYAGRQEGHLGLLQVGYLADFICLGDDVTQDPELLLTTSVEQVWVAGQLEYDRATAEQQPQRTKLGVGKQGISAFNIWGWSCPCCVVEQCMPVS